MIDTHHMLVEIIPVIPWTKPAEPEETVDIGASTKGVEYKDVVDE